MVWVSGRDIARDTIQVMLERALRGHVAHAARRADGDGYTFPTWQPHVRLDYLFTPAALRGAARACEVCGDREHAHGVGSLPAADRVRSRASGELPPTV